MVFFRIVVLWCFVGFVQVFSAEFENSFNHKNGDAITHFTVFGERSSGTNFLMYLVKKNIIGIENTSEYGHKHFPNWVDLSEYSFPLRDDKSFLEHSNHCLGILIVRNIYDWSRSFYRKHPYVSTSMYKGDFFEFLSEPWASDESKLAITIDNVNPYQDRPFMNILELRRF